VGSVVEEPVQCTFRALRRDDDEPLRIFERRLRKVRTDNQKGALDELLELNTLARKISWPAPSTRQSTESNWATREISPPSRTIPSI